MAADKLPAIPARTDALPFFGRIVSGAMVGASVCGRRQRVACVLTGAAGALVAAYALTAGRRVAAGADPERCRWHVRGCAGTRGRAVADAPRLTPVASLRLAPEKSRGQRGRHPRITTCFEPCPGRQARGLRQRFSREPATSLRDITRSSRHLHAAVSRAQSGGARLLVVVVDQSTR
jgi:hypothetical protein